MNRVIALTLATLTVAPLAWAQDDELAFDNGMFVIEGKVQKPEVVVVVSRDNLDKSFDIQLKESFLDLVVEALESAPF